MNTLSIKGLHKTYGRITAVNELSLDIPSGSIFGLLGPNGSGKTTTLGMVLGVIRPTKGTFEWFGRPPSHHVRKIVGAILEQPNFYPTYSAWRNLQLVCKIKEVSESRIHEVLELVGLVGREHDAFKTYSLGMKQRLAIGSALLADPEVLILDEPTNGLDPQGIAEIRDLIREIAQSGKTIILASHLLDEVQKVCTDFAILKSGQLIHTGKVKVSFGEDVILHVGIEDLSLLVPHLSMFPGYQTHKVLKDVVELVCDKGTNAAELNKFLCERRIHVAHLSTLTKNLEQQFIEILAQHA
ncbi:MAG: ABC transporter ATP-binding protein [Bacteroidota bacterium]